MGTTGERGRASSYFFDKEDASVHVYQLLNIIKLIKYNVANLRKLILLKWVYTNDTPPQ